MPKFIATGAAVLIAACGVAAISGRNEAEAQSQRRPGTPARAAAAPGQSWAGRYEGQFDGGRGIVEITSQGSGAYRAEVVTVGEQGCSGSVDGTVRPVGETMTIEKRNEYQAGSCRVSLSRRGTSLIVGESNCLDWHGMSCAFTGTVRRVGSGAAAPGARPSAARQRSWLIGRWIARGGSCRSGGGVSYHADGSFNAEGNLGRWSLNGTTLTETVESESEMGSGSAGTTHARITAIAPHRNAFTVRYPDGGVFNMVRCQ